MSGRPVRLPPARADARDDDEGPASSSSSSPKIDLTGAAAFAPALGLLVPLLLPFVEPPLVALALAINASMLDRGLAPTEEPLDGAGVSAVRADLAGAEEPKANDSLPFPVPVPFDITYNLLCS
jgi:hypothetical protein